MNETIKHNSMSKNLINEAGDFLHLYIGQECVANDLWQSKLVGIYPSEVEPGKMIAVMQPENQEFYIEQVKPILRTLNWMTDEEKIEAKFSNGEYYLGRLVHYQGWNNGKYSPEQTAYLLSKGFDIFNLIDRGLAIDSTKRVGVN
jgi:hypothetical protein